MIFFFSTLGDKAWDDGFPCCHSLKSLNSHYILQVGVAVDPAAAESQDTANKMSAVSESSLPSLVQWNLNNNIITDGRKNQL